MENRKTFPRHFMPRTRMSTPLSSQVKGFIPVVLLVFSFLLRSLNTFLCLFLHCRNSVSSFTYSCLLAGQSIQSHAFAYNLIVVATNHWISDQCSFQSDQQATLQRISLAESDVSKLPGCDNIIGSLMSIRKVKSRQQRRVSDSLQNPGVNNGARRSISCGSRS